MRREGVSREVRMDVKVREKNDSLSFELKAQAYSRMFATNGPFNGTAQTFVKCNNCLVVSLKKYSFS